MGEPSKRRVYTKWTQEVQRWLLPYVEYMESQLPARLKLLLSYCDPQATGTKPVFQAVAVILEKDAQALKDGYYSAAAAITVANIAANMNAHRWGALKKELERLLPAQGAQDSEVVLGLLQKETTESWLDFVARFRGKALDFGTFAPDDRRQAQIFFRKLPREMQNSFAMLKFECNMGVLETRIRNWNDWMSLAKSVEKKKQEQNEDPKKEVPGDPMELGVVSDENENLRFGNFPRDMENSTDWFKTMREVPISALKRYVGDLCRKDTRFKGYIQWLSRNTSTGFSNRNRRTGGGRNTPIRTVHFPDEDVNQFNVLEEEELYQPVEQVHLIRTSEPFKEKKSDSPRNVGVPKKTDSPRNMGAPKKSSKQDTYKEALLKTPSASGDSNGVMNASTSGNSNGVLCAKITLTSSSMISQDCFALIDTGAGVSIISSNLAERLNCKPEGEKISINIADGRSINTLGQTPEIRIDAEGKSVRSKFHILPDPGYDILLGIPDLRKLNAIIDVNRRMVTLGSGKKMACMTSSLPRGAIIPQAPMKVQKQMEFQVSKSHLKIKQVDTQTFLLSLGRNVVIGPGKIATIWTPWMCTVPVDLHAIVPHLPNLHISSGWTKARQYVRIQIANWSTIPVQIPSSFAVATFQSPAGVSVNGKTVGN
ncbi:MAG: hypothetical protein Crog4KO_36590 [Crocinitomicaceae bacterium]